jgi:uncharacterized protein (DUF2147 family)
MRRSTAAVFLLALCSVAQAQDASFAGEWARGDGKARVRIERCGGDLCAINSWIRPDVTDEKVGDRLIMNVADNGEGIYTGKAFDPQRNMNFGMTIKVAGPAMTSKGCILGGLICKAMHWKRLD